MFNLAAPPNFRGLHPEIPVTVYYRNLPHWRREGATYFVTFRLLDALPQSKLNELKSLRREWEARHPPPRSEHQWRDYARQVTRQAERWLDEGYGDCHFQRPELAKELEDALLHFQDERYFVSCYTVMPNHCHAVIRPYAGHPLEKILQVCKGFVAYKVNRAIGSKGSLWLDESYDQIIRDEEHLWNVVQYIGRNCARAGIPRERWFRWIHPAWEQAGWRFVDKYHGHSCP